MPKQKSERSPRPRKSKPPPDEEWLEQVEPKLSTFTEIGGSPVPGLRLRQVLRGHTNSIGRIAWSPDGAYLVSPSADKTTRIWDAHSGALIVELQGHTALVMAAAWSPDGRTLLTCSHDKTIRIWNVDSWRCVRILEKHKSPVNLIAFSPDGLKFASCDWDGKLFVWSTQSPEDPVALKGHLGPISALDWSAEGFGLTSCGENQLYAWNLKTRKLTWKAQKNLGQVCDVRWLPHQALLASSGYPPNISLWSRNSDHPIRVVEGHTSYVFVMSSSADGLILGSKSHDNTVRLWRTDTWDAIAVLDEECMDANSSIAFHPNQPILATLGENDTIIRIWDLDETLLLGRAQESVHYTTAKLVLVGDSGVGKTGLGWRLAHGRFKKHASTHGQQFWPIQKLGLKRKDGTECEAVLWDLAGQHVYRPIHSIFLDNVAAALVLFDPSNRQDPLKGVQFWLEQLKGKGQLPPTVLVGARVDRGAPAMSQQELEQFCQRHGIRGGYISTSAKSNEGVKDLLETLKAQIPWDEMTATVTTVTFKRIKEYVLALKEKPDRKAVLVTPVVLREHLQATDHDWRFSDAEMMTAVGHLETHGYVAILRSSAGEQHILLTPELLATLASSIVLLADKHRLELGAVSEADLLQGKVQFEEFAGLSRSETQILLDAAILRFIEHNICFRATLGDENLLIFPGLIKHKRPLQDDLPSTDDISYVVRGRVENLYPSLVVLLGYTPSFTRINQWQNQAQYEMRENEICGFRLIEDREGEIELVLYYGEQMPVSGRTQFQELFEQFLYQRDVEVTPFPPVTCVNKHQQRRATVIERVREGKPFMFCDECGEKITLPDFDKPQTIGISASQWLQREESAARLRSAYEVQLTKVKGYRRGWAMPRCYVSHLDEQSESANDLVKDLRDAGVYVVEQTAQVQDDDFIIVLDTHAYQKAFTSKASVLTDDIPLVNARLNKRKRQLISLALTGESVPHEFENCTVGSFCDDTHYPVSLFDLILNFYAIPLNHAGFAPLRQALHIQWEQTLAHTKTDNDTSPLKIFISYSHKDEAFRDELVTMLAGLQNRGIVDTWQDRCVEPGDEWYKSIQVAMNECDLALLLVSPDYIASGFIQEEEQPKLLERRKEMQLRVIPIIVRPCTWKSEPIIKDLQVLPKNGKAVIKFSKTSGARDEVWTDIANAIEERAKSRS